MKPVIDFEVLRRVLPEARKFEAGETIFRAGDAGIELFVDGRRYSRFTNEHKTAAQWPFDASQFLKLNFAVDIGFHIRNVPLQPADQMADSAGHAREPLGPDHDQSHETDHYQLGESDIEH